MVSPNVDRLLREAKSLSPEERRQLVDLLNADAESLMVDSVADAVEEAMVRDGLMTDIPPPATEEDAARFNAWRPVEVRGRPVSETLIEERR